MLFTQKKFEGLTLQIGAAAHELGHALGFFHTQSRYDRDSYVTVVKDRIRDEWLDQYILGTPQTNDNYGLPYDYGSLMHYGATSGLKDKKRKLLTILPMDLAYIDTLGSPFISFIDLLMINKHYNCTEDCPANGSAKCANNGFPHPRNCSECICPGGYGGPLCTDRPEGCGEILDAQYYPIEWVASVGNNSASEALREDFDICYYWIKAPVGRKVVVELLSFKPKGIAVDGCVYASTVKSAFKKAAELWAKDTCLNIVEDNNALDSIRVLDGGGCWSHIGRIGGVQNLSIDEKCSSIGAAAHELGHALGFFHTQSRHDRDSYVTVMKENIRDGWLDQFILETPQSNDNYGLPYDYGSLMQYGATSGSKNKEKLLTMLPTDLAYTETLGSPFISFIDLLMINKHYNCTENCPAVKSAKCANKGFPHPRNCSKCICPGGYGGPLCNDRPAGCGTTLYAGAVFVEWVASVGNESPGKKLREDFDMCYYWIKAPTGKKVMVELLSFKPDGIAVDGCIYGGVEFKWHWDQARTGSRYCSPQGSHTKLVSMSNIMPVIIYTRGQWRDSEVPVEWVASVGNKSAGEVLREDFDICHYWLKAPEAKKVRAKLSSFTPEKTAVDGSPSVRKVFEIAAKLWQRDTCLDIVENENASDAIRVLDMGGCWSYIGKIGGIQNLSLGVRCNSTRAAAHELGHALGFFHTQSRHDRDNYITVIIENIRAEKLNEFTLETKEINDNYDLPYDYGSLMHYGSTSSTKNKEQNLLTMLPMDLAYIETLGSPFISFIDLLMMNKHYNCTEDCPTEGSAKCENHGFPHPRNCSECICPGGYGGPLCNERPEGCGAILEAKSDPVEWIASIGNESATEELRVDFDMCYYWIKAPVGKKVVAQLLSFTPENIAVDGCRYGGVEIKWQRDQRRTGSRYCSKEGSYTELVSTSNIMPVIMFNRYLTSTTRIRYRYI
ncbi:hypothetical protein Q1695_001845 [Nippostrongylus brasiliensis]|nr:hypothetical protein Q1695_001845 [Nippostrongylus brasiliensis]